MSEVKNTGSKIGSWLVAFLKSGFWIGYYFVASLIGTVVALVALVVQNEGFMDTMSESMLSEDAALMDSLMGILSEAAVPGLIIGAVLCIIGYLLCQLIRKRPIVVFKMPWSLPLFCVGLGFVMNSVLTTLLSLLSPLFSESSSAALEEYTGAALTGHWAILLLGTGILVPIMEEIVFRFGVHRAFGKLNFHFAAFFSAIIFGLFHGNPIQIAYATLLGLVFAYFYQATGRLMIPILLHISINSSSVLMSQFSNSLSDVALLIITFAVGIVLVAFSLTCNKDLLLFLKLGADRVVPAFLRKSNVVAGADDVNDTNQ